MTPEKEIELCETVTEISVNLKNALAKQEELNDRLIEHTKADSDNFDKLSTKMDGLIAKDNQEIGAAKIRAFLWTLVTGGGMVAAWEFLKRGFGIH